MNLFKKKSSDISSIAKSEEVSLPSGKCFYQNCAQNAVFSCEYMDWKNQHCNSNWCPRHSELLDNTHYCRRHLPVILALRASYEEYAPRPEVGNRAPSLAKWMGETLDSRIQSLLDDYTREIPGSKIVKSKLIASSVNPNRIWEYIWRLVEGDYIFLKISIQVEEQKDSELIVRVSGEEVVRTVPYWIEDRNRDGSNSNQGVAKARNDYNDFLINKISPKARELFDLHSKNYKIQKERKKS